MLKFKLSAKMFSDILNATSNKGHIFVIPSDSGLSISNSKEEEDVSYYNIVPRESLESFEYDGNNEDAYCFMVQDIMPLISRISGDVTLSFDDLTSDKAFIHIESESGKFKGMAALKDEETMEESLGLDELKLDSRIQKEISLNDEIFIIPDVMYEIGENMLIKFENDYKPLIIDSDDITLTITKNAIKEKIRTITSEHKFTENFSDQKVLNGDVADFPKSILLNVTSSFLELAIKKHASQIQHILLLKLDSEMTPFNIVFLSKRGYNEAFFYTASIMTLRTNKEEEY